MAIAQRPDRGRLRDAARHQPPRPLRAHRPAAARCCARRRRRASSPCRAPPTRSARIDFDDLMGERSYGRWKAYGQSKLANLLFAGELAAARRRPAAVASPRTPATPTPTCSRARACGSSRRSCGSATGSCAERRAGRLAAAVRRDDARRAGRRLLRARTCWSCAATRHDSRARRPVTAPRRRAVGRSEELTGVAYALAAGLRSAPAGPAGACRSPTPTARRLAAAGRPARPGHEDRTARSVRRGCATGLASSRDPRQRHPPPGYAEGRALAGGPASARAGSSPCAW